MQGIPIVSLAACMAVAPQEIERRSETIPGAAAKLELVRIPGSPPGGDLWVATTETPWEAYDAFVYGLDEPAGNDGADAVTRPSQPYVTMDRGFGHAGYPAISMSFEGARAFCEWLSLRTGRTYRLPTEEEWERAARAGRTDPDGRWYFGDDPALLAEHAWTRENAGGKTHPVGSKAPSPWGLHDVYGNAAEWCVGADGEPVVRGGSFLDPAGKATSSARRLSSPAWNASDPQLPKSRWWLADAGFVGFRIVCEPDPGDAAGPGGAPGAAPEPGGGPEDGPEAGRRER